MLQEKMEKRVGGRRKKLRLIGAHIKKGEKRNCEYCNKSFFPTQKKGSWAKQKFCCGRCRIRAWNESETGKQKTKDRMQRYRKEDIVKVRNRYSRMKRNSHKTSRGKYWNLKYMAKQRNRDFMIDKDRFIEWFDGQDKLCHYCHQEVIFGYHGNGNYMDTLTIDRKDNDVGYFLTNIVLACRKCNTIKGPWFTEKQMKEIGKKYLMKTKGKE